MLPAAPLRQSPARIALSLGLLAFLPVLLDGHLGRALTPQFEIGHALTELLIVIASLLVAVVAWFRPNGWNPLRLFALGFLGVAVLGMLHFLSLPGMPSWAAGGSDVYDPTFGFAARLLLLATLFLIALGGRWQAWLVPLFAGAVLVILGFLAAALTLGMTAPPLLGVGVGMAYLLLAFLWSRRFDPPLDADLMVPGLLVLGIAEVLLSSDVTLGSMSHAMGHLYQLAGTALVLAAVVQAHIVRPHHDLRTEKRARERAAEQVHDLIQSAPDGILVVRGDGAILAANPAADGLFDAPPGRLVGREIEDLMPAEVRWQHHAERLAYQARPVTRPMGAAKNLKAQRLDGSQFFADIALSPLHWDGQRCTVAFVRDSTTRVEQMLRLDWLAAHDELTGLPNRWAILRELQLRLTGKESGVCLELGLDNLGRINDALGHDTGDQLLRAFAARLRALKPTEVFLGRTDGDRFVLLLPSRSETTAQIAALVDALNRPIELSPELRIEVTATGGSCRYPQDARTAEGIVQAVEVATTTAKQIQRRGIVAFHPGLRQRGNHWLAIASRLSEALEQDQFRLVYQPRIDLASGAPHGFEALMRWRTPEEDISPADFIPVAEESGFILPLGRWTIARVIEQAAQWRRQGLDPGRISMNLSARQLGDAGLPEFIAAQLLTHGLDAGGFEIEITETVAMENLEWALPRVEALAALGLRIALDDFGTGYSSLAYLQKLPAEVLKIDIRFVHAIGNTEGEMLLRTIVALAHGLGKETVAEGVETAEQDRWLREAGCHQAQGWLHGRPLESADVQRFLEGAATRQARS